MLSEKPLCAGHMDTSVGAGNTTGARSPSLPLGKPLSSEGVDKEETSKNVTTGTVNHPL